MHLADLEAMPEPSTPFYRPPGGGTAIGGTHAICTCPVARSRHLEVPNLRLGGAVMLIVGLGLMIVVSLWFAIMIELALSALAIVLAVAAAHMRCDRCGELVPTEDLARTEYRSLRVQQVIALGIASCMIAGAVWAKGRWDEERGVAHVMLQAEQQLEQLVGE